VDNSNTATTDDGGAGLANPGPALGKYSCTWRQEKKELHLPCEIRQEGQQKTLTLIVQESALHGSTTPTGFGFRFEGTFKNQKSASEQALSADFFSQGPGTYATVLTLDDKTHAKLDLQIK
jgi:hypothetical protein